MNRVRYDLLIILTSLLSAMYNTVHAYLLGRSFVLDLACHTYDSFECLYIHESRISWPWIAQLHVAGFKLLLFTEDRDNFVVVRTEKIIGLRRCT